MKRFVTALAIGLCLAFTAQASATTTAQITAFVKKGYTKQIRARARLAGLKVVGTTVKCASIGGQRWTCYGTYTIEKGGEYAKYAQYISVSPSGWKTQGDGNLVKQW